MYNKTIENGKLKMENEKKSGARSIKDEKMNVRDGIPAPPLFIEGTEKVSFVILNEMKDLLKVAIGGRFFALLRRITRRGRTF